jgi:hypothetical protein
MGQSWNGGRNRTPFHAEDDYGDIKRFAESAIEELKAANPAFIWKGLVRVDIMHSEFYNKFFVNEFESLEACYYSKKFEENEMCVRDKLRLFWSTIVQELTIDALAAMGNIR